MCKSQTVKLIIALFFQGLSLCCLSTAHATVGAHGINFPSAGQTLASQSTRLPAEVGLSSAVVSAMQSVITGGRWALWRHGYLIHVEGDFNLNSDIGAASMGIHAATTGVALERSLIPSLDEKLSIWNSELSGIDSDVSWRHVLEQSAALDDPLALPGSVWAFSNANAFQLNRALSRVWGRADLTDNYNIVLADALLDPIGAQGWSSSIATDGVHLHLDLEDMGRIGTLLIAGGAWLNGQVLPEWVVDLMVTRQSKGVVTDYDNANGGNTGLQNADFPESPYGLMTWVNTDQQLYPAADARWAVLLEPEGSLIAINPASGMVLAVENGSFLPVSGAPAGWPTAVRSAIETMQQQVVSENPLLPVSDYNVSDINVDVFPGASWQIREPEGLGMDSDLLDDFRSAIGGSGQGIVIKNGYQVYSWGSPSAHGEWASASKAMFSTLLFFAINETRIGSVDDLIADQGWSLSSADQAISFRHVANMISGYSLPEGPGTHWAYNDYGVQLYSRTILQNVFGINAENAVEIDALVTDTSRLGALQFEDGQLFSSTQRVNMSVRDYARVGWFWVNRGRWDGQALLPQSFFDDYMKVNVSAALPRTQGGAVNDYLTIGSYGGGNNQSLLGPGKFGFMWWFNADGSSWPDAPTDTFQVNGHWNGEVMTMIPSLGIVAAWRGGDSTNPNTFDGPMNTILKNLVDSVGEITMSLSLWGIPAVPSNVQLTEAENQNTLQWNINPEADIAGYRVLRSEVSGGPYGDVSGLITDNAFIDAGLQNGQQYYYVVLAEDFAGQQSVVSAELMGTPSVNLSAAQWLLDESSGSSANDSVGGSDGVVVGADWVTGTSGSALDFDGAGNHIQVLNTPALNIVGTQLTLSAWLFPRDSGASGGSRVISKRTTGSGSDVYAMYTQNNRLWFRIDGQDMASNYVFEANQWVHVTMVYNGEDKRIYINGILDSANPQVKADTIDSSTRPLHIGMREGESRYFNGVLDDIRIYNIALSAAEIASMDQDGDGLTDYIEVVIGTSLRFADTDNDGLSDFDEVNVDANPGGYTPGVDTNPLLFDTDGDGYGDGEEVAAGSDPLDNASIPLVASGDINNDGQVNAADLLLATRILTGAYIPTREEQERWDVAPLVNGIPEPDSQNTAGDLVVLQRKVLGQIDF